MTQIQQAKQKIMVIIPIAKDSAEAFMHGFETEINAAISSDFEVTYKSLPGQATPFIQSRTAEFWDTFGIIEIAQQAQKEGFNISILEPLTLLLSPILIALSNAFSMYMFFSSTLLPEKSKASLPLL